MERERGGADREKGDKKKDRWSAWEVEKREGWDRHRDWRHREKQTEWGVGGWELEEREAEQTKRKEVHRKTE